MKKERDAKFNESLLKNEIAANKAIATASLITAGVILLLWLVFLTGIVKMKNMTEILLKNILSIPEILNLRGKL